MKKMKRVVSALLAIIMVLSVCFQHGIGAKAADAGTPVETDVSAIWSGQNGQMITFQLSKSDWDSHGQQNVVPGSTYNTYNFYNQIKIYYDDGNGEKSIPLANAHYDQIYWSMWGNTNALSIQINPSYYQYATKIVIPAGTIFPAFAYTGGTPLGGSAIAGTSSAMNGYIVTEDIVYEGTKNATSQTYWERKKSTAIENVRFDLQYDGAHRMIFNIVGDTDNDALPNWCYITNPQNEAFNTKDYVQIYIKGESTPKTLRDFFKTSDGNMYWNLYEAGSMTFPVADDFSDATTIEKIVIKKGCEFPSVAYTGAIDPVNGGSFSATTNSKTSYVLQEDVTYVLSEDATATNASFVFTDTSTTTETAVTGVKTGHSNKNVTFTLSVNDYAGCSTSRASDKFLDYNFLDKVQIISGDTIQTLREVYPMGDERYYNLWDAQNTFTIALGNAYDTVTKIVIPAGTVFPSAFYTGYGAWDATTIPDNMVKNKGGFETTEDIIFEKPEGSGELAWTVAKEEVEVTQAAKVDTIHVRGDGSDFRLLLFTSNNDYAQQEEAPFTKVSEYNTLDNIILYDVDGNEILLKDLATEKTYYKCWGDAGSIGFGIQADAPLVAKVVIKAGCELPTYAYTNGDATERTMYVVENETVFTLPAVPADNKTSTNWYRDEILPVKEVETDITNIHIRTGATEGTRFMLFSSVNDYGTTDFNIGADTTKFAKYNTLDKIELETTSGEKYTLSEIYDGVPAYNLWGDAGCFSMKLTDGLNPIYKVTIKAGCEIPSRAFTEGTADSQLTYVVKNEIIFTFNGTPVNNQSNTNWNREEILPVEPVDTDITNIHIRTPEGSQDTRLLLFTSVNDYGNSDANVSVDLAKLAKYNLLDHIVFYTTTGEEFLLKDVYDSSAMYNIWGEYGSVAIELTGGLNPIHKVVIKEGCELPSRAFTEGTADSQLTYKITEDITFIHNTTPTNNTSNTNWKKTIVLPEVKETTKISNVHVRGGGTDYRLLLFLSNHDYEQQLDISFSKVKEYNMLDYISLYDVNGNEIVLNTIDEERAYYKCWGDAGSIGIGIDETIPVITKVKIKAGCEIPSQDYTNGSPSQKTIYVVENDTTFTLSAVPSDNSGSVHWNREETLPKSEVATDISYMHIRTGAVPELLLFLTNNDYGTQRDVAVSNALMEKYNTLSKIELKTVDGETIKLQDVYNQAAYLNRWDDKDNSFAIQMQEDLKPICEVKILAGCQIPSKSYIDGTGDTEVIYVIPEDITFTYNGTPTDNKANTSWTKEEVYPVEVENTEIQQIHVRTGSDTELLLFLSNNDYKEATVSMNVSRLVKYNTLDNILLYTTTGSVYTLRQVYDNAAFYNLWSETGSVAIQLNDTVGVISKVYIKAGCELPSLEYTNGSNLTRKLTYVVSEDTLFTVKEVPSSNVSTVHWDKTNPRTIATDINKITFADNVLDICLNISDYGTSQSLMGAKHFDYNYLSKVRLYTSDTEFVTLATALADGNAWFNADNSIELTLNISPIRVVIPSDTVFPTKAYVDGTKQEMSGYEILNEKIYELVDGIWKDVSMGVSRIYGDANGDGEINSIDIVRMKKYIRDGYGMNNFGNCDDDAAITENDVSLLRKSLVGSYTLHPYIKESSALTYFMSQDDDMDYFLNDYFKRHAGYVDYVEGDMTATSYRPGEYFDGIYNTQWLMEASTWYSADGFDMDTAESLKTWLNMIPVDRYGYVWNGNDVVEDSNTDLANAKHAMGWPLPNANDANADTSDISVFWDFNEEFENNKELGCTWSNNINATASNGLYTGTASGKSNVYFEVKDYVVIDWFGRDSIVQTEYAPWLALDLRMSMDDLSVVDDIYIYYTTSDDEAYSTTKRVSVKDTAPIWYEMTGQTYEHMLYVPMFTQDGWYSGDGTSAKTGASDIYKIKIEIVPVAGKTLSGTFALNYVRPSFDTRYSNNNALYISTLKEYYSMTGDIAFVEQYITNARKAMNFLMQMYDADRNLNDQSYMFGHYGSTTELYDGITNGFWDVTYTPIYDFQSNLYFYEALKDLIYLEDALSEAGITVSDSAAVETATIQGFGNSDYTYGSQLETVATNVLAAIQETTENGGFWNGTRFVAGKDNTGNVVDNGQVVWNLQAIEAGIATEEQATSIMTWIDSEANMYQNGMAPLSNTIDNLTSNMYSSFYEHTSMADNGVGAFGQNVQNGGAVMFSSYYDLMSRLQVNGVSDAYQRLSEIRDWYLPIAEAYDYSTEDAEDFYYNYYKSMGKADNYLQNGKRAGAANGVVGLDGEFPESLLTVAAIPRGFFGVESVNANCLGLTPVLPEELQHWKIENMEFHNVKYDVSLFDGIVRVDSVEGETSGLTLQISLDYADGQKVYVNDKEVTNYVVNNGKAIVTVAFEDVIVEVR